MEEMIGSTPPLVEIQELTVRVPYATLLDRLSLNIEPGLIHILSGPNGAGKTTLLRALLGQIPFEGTIRCHWRNTGKIGYVPQQFDFDREIPLTAEDFLSMMWQRRPVCLGRSRALRARIAEALERMGVSNLAQRKHGVLSGGELQRLLLVQALEPLPELLLLDEPTAWIDDKGMRAVEERLIRVRNQGVTVLMVSHDSEQARRIGDRIIHLNRTLRESAAVDHGH
jgi:zinc transport system ATP-binding protein